MIMNFLMRLREYLILVAVLGSTNTYFVLDSKLILVLRWLYFE